MKLKDKILGNVLVIAAIELIIIQVGIQIVGGLTMGIDYLLSRNPGPNWEFISTAVFLSLFIIPIVICLIFMRITKKECLKVFAIGTIGKRIANAFLGLLIGVGCNALLSMLVYLTGGAQAAFNVFSWRLIVILPCCFIQCAMEEVLLRGFVSTYLEEAHRWDVVALVGGVLFIFHHVGNMSMYGFSSVFCLNVFLIGVALYLMMKLTGNFWVCCGFHTGWNYTQQFLFGLPNSGMTSGFALFRGGNAVKSFFFDPVYGNEGSLCTTTLSIIMIVVLLILIKKKSTKEASLLEIKMIERG